MEVNHFCSAFLTKLDGKMPDEYIKTVKEQLDIFVCDYEIQKRETALAVMDEYPQAYVAFFVTKKIEGLSEKTLYKYRLTVGNFFKTVRKRVEDITTNDLRLYFYNYQKEHGVSNATLNNMRLDFSSFFGWCLNEQYITKNPCRAIAPIKHENKPVDTLTDIELEHMRDKCRDLREKAIVDVLYATGCRVSELIGLKKSDLDLYMSRKTELFGKGSKHRTSYVNARSIVSLENYYASRTDDSEYVIVSLRRPYHPLTRNTIEKIIKRLGIEAHVNKGATPHKLRRTMATDAISRGVPVTHVQCLLGHKSVETTMYYVKNNMEDVKTSHNKFIV